MEDLDGRLSREWPNVDVEGFRESLLDLAQKRQLKYMDDVTVDEPAKGQCLLYNGKRWIAGSVTPTGDIQVTDHGAMTGLNDDDHPQYLNNERALHRFYTKVEIDDYLNNKASAEDVDDLINLIEEVNNKPVPTLKDLGAAGVDHSHNNLYYTKSEVDSALGQKADSNKIYSHADLSDLNSDDHKQYLNEVRGDLRYYTKIQADDLLDLKSDVTRVANAENRITELENKPDQGVTNHTDLTGLDLDDHPQYFNQERGDLRYYTKSEMNNSLSSKVEVTDMDVVKNRVEQLEGRPVFDSLNYYTKAQINNSLSNKANITDINNLTTRTANLEARQVFDNSLYFNKTEVNNLLSSKVDNTNHNAVLNRIGLLESYGYPLSEYGLYSASIPLHNSFFAVSMTNAKMWLSRIKVPANMPISKIAFYVRTAGSMPGTAASGVAIYSDSGSLLGSVLNNAFFTSVGWKTAALNSPIIAQSTDRFVWVGMVANFSTIPAIAGVNPTPVNGGIISTHRRCISIAATSTFPANFAPATFGTNEETLTFVGLGA